MHRLLPFIPKRYHVFVLDHVGIVIAAAIFVICAAAFVIFYKPSKYWTESYFLADVLSVADTSSDQRVSYRAVIRLPNGETSQIGASGFVQAQMMMEPICVAQKRNEKGRIWHAIADPKKCAQ